MVFFKALMGKVSLKRFWNGMTDSNQFDISHTQYKTLYLKADIDDTKGISLNALVFGEGNPEYRSISKTEQKCDKESSYSISKAKKKGKNLQRHNWHEVNFFWFNINMNTNMENVTHNIYPWIKSSLKLWRKNQLIWHVNLVIVRAKNAPVACIVATWCPN